MTYPEEYWLEPLRQSTERIRKKTEAIRQETENIRKESEGIRRETECIRQETENLRQQNDSLRSLAESEEKLKQIVESSIINLAPMTDSDTRDYFQQQQDRQELQDAVDTLGSFIFQVGPHLSVHQSRRLAMQILENGEKSGVVSAARAARLLAEADDA
jgi:uncharacterized protein (DUF3084 family)